MVVQVSDKFIEDGRKAALNELYRQVTECFSADEVRASGFGCLFEPGEACKPKKQPEPVEERYGYNPKEECKHKVSLRFYCYKCAAEGLRPTPRLGATHTPTGKPLNDLNLCWIDEEGTIPESAWEDCLAEHEPSDEGSSKWRKERPVATGVLDYFPDAILEVANCSLIGNLQHLNRQPGEKLVWDKSKSTDEADALVRHLMQRGTLDDDGIRHSVKVAWRALALLQRELEAAKVHGSI